MKSTIIMEKEIVKVKLSDLKPHPENERIYGNENVEKLQYSIDEFGLFDPLVVNEKMEVVSGNSRLKAIKNLDWDEVEVERIVFESEEEELAYLLEANTYRDKTRLQRIHEGLLIERIVQLESKARMLATLNHVAKGEELARENFTTLDETGESDKGRTEAIVADKIGIGNYMSYRHGRFVALKIREYQKGGLDEKKIQSLSDLLENSIDAAFKAAKKDLLKKQEFENWKQLKKMTIELAKEPEPDKTDPKEQLNEKLDQFVKLQEEIVELNIQIEWKGQMSPVTADHLKVFKLFVSSKLIDKALAHNEVAEPVTDEKEILELQNVEN